MCKRCFWVAARFHVSRRDSMIVAWHEVPGTAPQTSRTLRLRDGFFLGTLSQALRARPPSQTTARPTGRGLRNHPLRPRRRLCGVGLRSVCPYGTRLAAHFATASSWRSQMPSEGRRTHPRVQPHRWLHNRVRQPNRGVRFFEVDETSERIFEHLQDLVLNSSLFLNS
jgi:hypothetical protein